MDGEISIVRWLVIAFVLGLAADVVDDMAFGNLWAGPSSAFYGLIGTVVVAMLTRKYLKNGSGKK